MESLAHPDYTDLIDRVVAFADAHDAPPEVVGWLLRLALRGSLRRDGGGGLSVERRVTLTTIGEIGDALAGVDDGAGHAAAG